MDCLEETKTMEETQPMLNTVKEKWEEIHFSLLPTIQFPTTASCWPMEMEMCWQGSLGNVVHKNLSLHAARAGRGQEWV